ncbi:MAG TPA: 1-phosphofructokinase family hexose kinase [Pontiella sp.]
MKTFSKPVICCGFSPCVQRILEFRQLEKGKVNRTGRVTVNIGGKGANTARMVKQLGDVPLLLGFSGGANGRLLERMLKAEGVDFRHVEAAGETRICQTLVEEGYPETTELVEEMPPITLQEWNRMRELFTACDLSGAIVAVSGRLPAGAPVDGYAQLCREVRERDGRVILDTVGAPLKSALKEEPDLVKMNDEELHQTTGADEVTVGCRALLNGGARAVLITRGSRSIFFADGSRTLEILPPEIEAVNPVGSGDAVTAGVAAAMNRGEALAEAVMNGIACGAANALNLLSGYLNPDDVERLKPDVRVVNSSPN